jgi:hypothetical protein
MELKQIIKRARPFSSPFRVDSGKRFRLGRIDPGDTLHLDSEDKPRPCHCAGGAPRHGHVQGPASPACGRFAAPHWKKKFMPTVT